MGLLPMWNGKLHRLHKWVRENVNWYISGGDSCFRNAEFIPVFVVLH